ncbi:hypothetical protein MJO28_017912 [Puccinia striiformis f. sp. tritici]|uniref:Uncharacterized protein n=1 Tax=Puccinia striiformis TaxID=27350 RepID=A0A2S4V850_9BASI|nr:hypothetical protein MJO28_017912 [Puccinia striiformis f. sp. tritici]POW05709.1 hypothetical protein PSTT_09457 [Puccinia striiformis]
MFAWEAAEPNGESQGSKRPLVKTDKTISKAIKKPKKNKNTLPTPPPPPPP